MGRYPDAFVATLLEAWFADHSLFQRTDRPPHQREEAIEWQAERFERWVEFRNISRELAEHIDRDRPSLSSKPLRPFASAQISLRVPWFREETWQAALVVCRKLYALVRTYDVRREAAERLLDHTADAAPLRVKHGKAAKAKQSPRKTNAPKRRQGKWRHVWNLIQQQGATDACGIDQKIANMHNKLCTSKINAGECEKIDVAKVAQIRYEYKHAGRHRKQKHRRRSKA